jgi:uncharacterized protein with beta-barrel porin domain
VSLNAEERSTHSLLSDLGLRLGLSLDAGRGDLISTLYAAWRHGFAVDEGTITAAFADATDASFTIPTLEPSADGLLLGVSLMLKDFERFSAALKYDLELRGPYRANSLSGEIHYGF